MTSTLHYSTYVKKYLHLLFGIISERVFTALCQHKAKLKILPHYAKLIIFFLFYYILMELESLLRLFFFYLLLNFFPVHVVSLCQQKQIMMTRLHD